MLLPLLGTVFPQTLHSSKLHFQLTVPLRDVAWVPGSEGWGESCRQGPLPSGHLPAQPQAGREPCVQVWD